MDEADWLAARFEEQRPHLRAVAYRRHPPVAAGGHSIIDALMSPEVYRHGRNALIWGTQTVASARAWHLPWAWLTACDQDG
jgi:hypothetical protein